MPKRSNNQHSFSQFIAKRERRKNLAFLGPSLALYILFFALSLSLGIYYSFTDWGGLTSANNEFVGFSNYFRLFSDADFWASLWITLRFAFFNVIGISCFALLFALGLTTSFRLNPIYRTILFMPNLFSLIVTGAVWKFLFRSIIPKALVALHVTAEQINILADTNTIILSVVIVSLWQGIGYTMLINIAGLQSIDQNIVEAARIDGANRWQLFTRIMFPQILPVVKVGFILSMVGSMKVFDSVLSLTNGGPGRASEVVMLNVYREAFERKNFGYGNAKALLLTVIIFIIALVQLKVSSRNEE